ncbi:MAG: hypothetical protein A3G32_03350 [Deltaproteobacteria bacterium RIFCSPLOWO2_12_FULL_40_28]|nr:MAG: hypothetical protein A3C45_02035 [Deltaproteobacteria bacterium RIFCSPHIGHO2_02_FULL_40_28]OGQ20132.1 MAG: hypothetical protein A3E27_01330 [Deltaproteobacteria bacterium RIFCSPHIGHO2_12_FULL_40_32]OGQ40703.1 MAG: hypothetical protein A3I69_02595 [Deltaproteobacteria bacterium RIFCSPLOWO2_02_FULL_40_36]OGQ54399.1 MAG: hypothetical protein A3G32_03350 [Deltaproteobacteria bacterium RIFCSPLOWO2_12_FULL_40_28]
MKHLIGEHIVGGFDGVTITAQLHLLVQKYHLGGFIFFRRNIENTDQVLELTQSLQEKSENILWMGVDQEGGRVFRLGEPFTTIPTMAIVGEYYRRTKNKKVLFQLGKLLGTELKAVGFNWDYAPVVDVHSNPQNPIIGDRSFSPDPHVVTQCAEAVIKGLHSVGVVSCIKHFPGHGETAVDSHLKLPVVKSPGRLLWKRDVFPFRELIKKHRVPTLMTAHVKYMEFDKQNCATLSKPILTRILRGRLGYKNLIVSDDLFMKAIADRYSLADACEQFFMAGGDIALICKEPELQIEVIEQLEKSVSKSKAFEKKLTESYSRIKRIKKHYLKNQSRPSLEVIGCVAHKEIANIF